MNDSWVTAFGARYGEVTAQLVNHAIATLDANEQGLLFEVLQSGLYTLHVIVNLDPFELVVFARGVADDSQRVVWRWQPSGGVPSSPAPEMPDDTV